MLLLNEELTFNVNEKCTFSLLCCDKISLEVDKRKIIIPITEHLFPYGVG